MKIVIFSNFINHHQVPVADELYQLCEGDFYFVETSQMPSAMLSLGYPDYSTRPYVVKAWESQENKQTAFQLAKNADVALFGGSEVLQYAVFRAKDNSLSFDVSERWLKKGILNLFSPRLLKLFCYYKVLFHRKQFYKLCASSYAAVDHSKLGMYENRCFKWGYFTKVEHLKSDVLKSYVPDDIPRIMWCARFLKLKHPDLPVKLAARLKQKGYKFILDMFGSGEELENTKSLIKELCVDDVVNICGNRPNDEILREMRDHDIFLFTSDKNEGWGAVLNESMSSGCAVVGSDEIGSVPFLIEDGVNGCIFKSNNLDSLEEKVIYLLDHPNERIVISQNAYYTMRDVWSPKNAANQLLNLINCIKCGDETKIPKSGPCSRA